MAVPANEINTVKYYNASITRAGNEIEGKEIVSILNKISEANTNNISKHLAQAYMYFTFQGYTFKESVFGDNNQLTPQFVNFINTLATGKKLANQTAPMSLQDYLVFIEENKALFEKKPGIDLETISNYYGNMGVFKGIESLKHGFKTIKANLAAVKNDGTYNEKFVDDLNKDGKKDIFEQMVYMQKNYFDITIKSGFDAEAYQKIYRLEQKAFAAAEASSSKFNQYRTNPEIVTEKWTTPSEAAPTPNIGQLHYYTHLDEDIQSQSMEEKKDAFAWYLLMENMIKILPEDTKPKEKIAEKIDQKDNKQKVEEQPISLKGDNAVTITKKEITEMFEKDETWKSLVKKPEDENLEFKENALTLLKKIGNKDAAEKVTIYIEEKLEEVKTLKPEKEENATKKANAFKDKSWPFLVKDRELVIEKSKLLEKFAADDSWKQLVINPEADSLTFKAEVYELLEKISDVEKKKFVKDYLNKTIEEMCTNNPEIKTSPKNLNIIKENGVLNIF